VTTTIAVLGARGRMGQAIVRLAADHGAHVVWQIDLTDGNLASLATSGARVLVDFSAPAVVTEAARACAAAGVALVSGTTGLDDGAKAALDEAAKKVPVLWEPNMSVGVYVLGEVLRRALAMLGDGFDVEIVETHHGLKADAPSGTAHRLAEIALTFREGPPITGRSGKPGKRSAEEVGVLAVRGGDVVGDHVVHLLGHGERLELTHRATSRDVFAIGALRAASWIAGQPAGRYALADVIGSAG
jgi:4-hydroxy-tetrahydrodipicolinate reductase